MDLTAIESALKAGIADCELEIQAEGNKIFVSITSDDFEGLNRVKRQQKIYSLLNDRIQSGEIHAVTMVTRTRAEAADG